MDDGDRVEVEKLGGYAGFGLPGSKLRSRCELRHGQLDAALRRAVDAMFERAPATRAAAAAPVADGFRYRITLHRADGHRQSVDLPERDVPAFLRASVRDELL